MSLSDAKVRNAKPKSKPYKIADGEGLFLLVNPSGSKYWRLKYHFAGREKLLAFGVYPEVSLGDARERRFLARKQLAAGNDPGYEKMAAKLQSKTANKNTFEAIAIEWHEKRKHKWNKRTAEIHLMRLEKHVFPTLGSTPISEISALECLKTLQLLEAEKTLETARRVMQDMGKIFVFAIASQRADNNPMAGLGDAIATPQPKHHAFLTAKELPEFYKRLQAGPASPLTKLGLKLIILTMLRSGELRGGKWKEIDFKSSEWRIPPERMKMKSPHIVPLSRQSVKILREIETLTGHGELIFPNDVDETKTMSENTLLYALYDLKYNGEDGKATVHGFRSTASTVLNENDFPSDWIERQLAHQERNSVRAAYNHAQHLPQRRKMMQWWADYLDGVTPQYAKS
jgi:integrase